MEILEHAKHMVGIVIIGRNEGKQLQRAFASINNCSVGEIKFTALYVDSGSTDGSVELSKSYHIPFHCLDATQPFSAARARLEGAERLIAAYPELQFLQFLDGDCTLEKEWLNVSVSYINQHQDVAIVCGKLKEADPERSIFNKFSALRWKHVSVGEIDTCGGIFLIRRSVYESVGGFNPQLLTGEEQELCLRVRSSGYKVIRLDANMACHDSALVHFSDWWRRAVWGGYGDALAFQVLSGDVSPQRSRETRSIFIWVVIVPLIGLSGAVGIIWSKWFIILPVFSVLSYFILVTKIVKYRCRQGDSIYDAVLYALLTIFRKLPNGIGFLRCRLMPDFLGRRPDPHRKKIGNPNSNVLNS